jgi:microcystin-dependent protein
MMEPFLGQLMCVGFTFAPKGWAFCNGQLMSISQNSALFSLLGTTYGGDGRTTFALPNLQGRAPIHFGEGAGLPNFAQGEEGGGLGLTTGGANTNGITQPYITMNWIIALEGVFPSRG